MWRSGAAECQPRSLRRARGRHACLATAARTAPAAPPAQAAPRPLQRFVRQVAPSFVGLKVSACGAQGWMAASGLGVGFAGRAGVRRAGGLQADTALAAQLPVCWLKQAS